MRPRRSEDMPTVSGLALGNGSAANATRVVKNPIRMKAERMGPPPKRAAILGQRNRGQSPISGFSSLQGSVQERQADIHPVVDVGVVVVELLVGVPDAVLGERLGEKPAAEVDVVLVAPAAVDIDASQRPEIRLVARNKVNRVVL